MGVFAKLGEAEEFKDGIYFEPGKYLLKINRMKINQDRKKVDQFIAEFLIVESTSAKRPVGTTVDFLIKATNDYFFRNVKGLLRVAYTALAKENDIEPPAFDTWTSQEQIKKEWEKLADDAVASDSPLVGVTIAAHAYTHTTQKEKEITRVKFHMPDEEADEVAA